MSAISPTVLHLNYIYNFEGDYDETFSVITYRFAKSNWVNADWDDYMNQTIRPYDPSKKFLLIVKINYTDNTCNTQARFVEDDPDNRLLNLKAYITQWISIAENASDVTTVVLSGVTPEKFRLGYYLPEKNFFDVNWTHNYSVLIYRNNNQPLQPESGLWDVTWNSSGNTYFTQKQNVYKMFEIDVANWRKIEVTGWSKCIAQSISKNLEIDQKNAVVLSNHN